MKIASHIAGGLLGLVFVFASVTYFFPMGPMPEPPAGSPPALFVGAMVPTGYLAFVKVLELVGGILVAIPRTRPLGLLILGPIIVNILCFNIFLTHGAGLFPLPLLVAVLALFLLWAHRAAFAPLLAGAK